MSRKRIQLQCPRHNQPCPYEDVDQANEYDPVPEEGVTTNQSMIYENAGFHSHSDANYQGLGPLDPTPTGTYEGLRQ